MLPHEEEVFIAMREQQVRTVDIILHRLGYTGTFAKAYDPRLDKTIGTPKEYRVERIFTSRPRLIKVSIYAIASTAGYPKTDVVLISDRPLPDYYAIDRFIEDCFCPGPDHSTPPDGFRNNDREISIPLSGKLDADAILDRFGLKGISVADMSADYTDEDEDIEIDLDDPLGLDFPEPPKD